MLLHTAHTESESIISGNEYWTELLVIPERDSLEYVIPHQEVTITAVGEYTNNQHPLTDSEIHLFTPTGFDQEISAITDDNGKAVFFLPANDYAVRLDYMGQQYLGETFNQTDTVIAVAEGIADTKATD